jgi:hypothetical protein
VVSILKEKEVTFKLWKCFNCLEDFYSSIKKILDDFMLSVFWKQKAGFAINVIICIDSMLMLGGWKKGDSSVTWFFSIPTYLGKNINIRISNIWIVVQNEHWAEIGHEMHDERNKIRRSRRKRLRKLCVFGEYGEFTLVGWTRTRLQIRLMK